MAWELPDVRDPLPPRAPENEDALDYVHQGAELIIEDVPGAQRVLSSMTLEIFPLPLGSWPLEVLETDLSAAFVNLATGEWLFGRTC